MPGELLTLRQVLGRTGLARRTLFRYRERTRDPFPTALRVGERTVLFRSDEVDEWIKRHPVSAILHRDP